MKITTKTTFKQLQEYTLTGFITEAHIHALMNRPRPSELCGVPFPENLDHITLIQLHRLRGIKNDITCFSTLIDVILGIPYEKVVKAPAYIVISAGAWIMKELERISRAFSAIKTSYTAEELSAGVKSLDFGYYGMADCYARRMGITDPDEVMNNVPWLKIWHAMKMDNDIDKYRRRLQNVYKEKSKKK